MDWLILVPRAGLSLPGAWSVARHLQGKPQSWLPPVAGASPLHLCMPIRAPRAWPLATLSRIQEPSGCSPLLGGALIVLPSFPWRRGRDLQLARGSSDPLPTAGEACPTEGWAPLHSTQSPACEHMDLWSDCPSLLPSSQERPKAAQPLEDFLCNLPPLSTRRTP